MQPVGNKENQVTFGLESLNQSLKNHYNENVDKNGVPKSNSCRFT